MRQPFFSIVLPTKNRPELLREAIISVLRQDFDDYELIVSDNFNDQRTYEVVSEFGNDSHLKYIRTSSELNMPDHWEWATLKAIGQYTLVLTDRSVLKRDSLRTLFDLIKTSEGMPIYAWRWSLFDNKTGIVFGNRVAYPNDPRVIKVIRSEDLVRSFLESPQLNLYVLPRGLNSCYRFDIAEDIRAKFGRLFMPIAPDFSSALLLLSQSDGIGYIDRSLFLSQGLETSSGSQHILSTAATLEYFRTLGDPDLYEYVPIKAPIVDNILFNEFLRIQKLATGNLQNIKIDWVKYFVRCYGELLQKAGSRSISQPTLTNLRSEFQNALSHLDTEVQTEVNARIRGLIFPLLKARLKKSFLAALAVNLKRYLEFKGRYKDVLQAAGF